MEPYSISCTTCQVRLKVRDPSAIGQILTCPKCGSMVLITPPPGHDATAQPSPVTDESAANSGADHTGLAAAERASDAVPESPTSGGGNALAQPNARVSDTTKEQENTPTAKGSVAPQSHADEKNSASAIPVPPPRPSTLSASAVDRSLAEDEEGAHDLVLQEAPQVGDATELLPPHQWASVTPRPWQHWLLMGAAATTGILLAVVLFGYVTSRLAGTPSGPPATQAAVDPLPDPARLDQAAEQQESPADPEEPPAELEEDQQTNPGPSNDGEHPSEHEAGSEDVQVTPPEDPALGIEPEADLPTDESPPPLPPVPADAASPPGLVPADPPSGDPPGADAADAMAGSRSLSEMLNQFQVLLGEPEQAAVEPSEELPDGSADATELPIESGSTTLARPQPHDIDVDARLADTMQAIRFESTPLLDLLRFLTQYSTVPISADPDSLIWLNALPDRPVTIELSDARLEDILDAVVRPLGLSWEVSDQRITIRRVTATPDGLRQFTFDLADLARDSDDLQSIAQMVVTLIEPSSWSSAGGEGEIAVEAGTLVVKQRESVLFPVLFFCDQLRTARGIPTPGRYPDRHFQSGSRRERAAATLARPLTMTFIRPTPLVRLVREIEKRGGVRILIDWDALATARWSPDAELSLTAHDQPLETVLDNLLNPMELTFRVCDVNLFQVTTPERLEETAELAWYPDHRWRSSGEEPAARLERLRSEVADSELAAGVDPLSGALFVSASSIRHRQLTGLFEAAGSSE